jgi:hypothetical protein
MGAVSQPEPEARITVYVVNATRTSAGPGPGPKTLPAGEAAWLCKNKLAVYGSEAPKGLLDGGAPPAYLGMMPRDA